MILIVDDEALIRNVIREYAQSLGYQTDEADNGNSALEKLKHNTYDLLILDIMMPEMDGFSMLEKLPKERQIPTIILSARDQEVDKLYGFELGIDDYLAKPFSPKELMARINAVMRRTKQNREMYKLDNLEVDFLAHTVRIDQKNINMTPKEFEILTYLIKNKNIVIYREQLLSKLWGYDYFGDDRTIDTHIKMLRSSLGKYRNHIVTVRGCGYKFVDEK